MVKERYSAIIQARTTSTRLPGKIFRKIGDYSLIDLLIKRLSLSIRLDEIIIATSDDRSDDLIENYCLDNNIKFFRGDLEDVLSRFYECALAMNINNIVRVTADDPFKDPKVIDHAIQLFDSNNYDYLSNTIIPTFPEGIDIEVFKFESLKKAYQEARLDSDRMHVTPYIWKNSDIFSIHNFENSNNFSNIRLTVDYEEDLVYLNKIFKQFNNLDFSFEDIVSIITKYNLTNTKDTVRNEGYNNDRKDEN